MTTTTNRLGLACAAVLLVACPSEDDAPATGDGTGAATADACANAADVGWLGAVAKDPAALEGAGGGWAAFYQRSYATAGAKFAAAGDDPVARAGAARAHLRDGALALSLARTQARAQAAYFAARDQLDADAQTLAKAPLYRGLAQHFAGDVTGAQSTLQTVAKGKGPHAALAKAWPSACPAEVKAADAWGQVAALAACAGAARPACPAEAKPATGPWAARITAYRAALCDAPEKVDTAALGALVARPAETETLRGKGDLSTEVEYFDALGVWVLGQAHLRKAAISGDDATSALLRAWAQHASGDVAGAKAAARAIDASKVDARALVLSGFATASALQAYLQSGASAPAGDALEAMHAATAAHLAAAKCVGQAKGLQVVDELGLAPLLAREALRRAARPLLADEKTCGEALRLLRGTLDVENLESVSYLNEPSAFAALAEAAVCMRRGSEAIGALRAVQAGHPAAAGALAAARQLSVVRLMGGTGGTQKVQ